LVANGTSENGIPELDSSEKDPSLPNRRNENGFSTMEGKKNLKADETSDSSGWWARLINFCCGVHQFKCAEEKDAHDVSLK
jgi:hypothetical protein